MTSTSSTTSDADPGRDARQVDEAAIRRFRAEHRGLQLAPVVVVIPALNEEAWIDDGSSDATASVARAHGARVARRERNHGQGAAFRVGYRLAWEHGARYVVTLDADGQWDPAEIPTVLQPVVDGDA